MQSIYQEQIDRGFGTLQFASELEEDYADTEFPARLKAIRWSTALVLLLVATTTMHMTNIGDRLLLSVPVATLCSALFAFTFLSEDRRIFDMLGVGTFGAALSLTWNATYAGEPSATALTIVLALSALFLFGLGFRLAVCCLAVLLPGTLIVMGFAGATLVELLASGLAIALAIATGVAAAWRIDFEKRRSFLADREIRFQRTCDQLTGLGNRRGLDAYLPRAFNHCIRDSIPIAVARIKIDHFRQYADFYGFDAAEACLLSVSKTIRESCRRPLDYVARLDGEDFLVVLPGCNLRRAFALVESIRSAVIAAVVEHAASPTSALLTISGGVASCSPKHYASASLLLEADNALAEAIEDGCNTVVAAEEPEIDDAPQNVIRLADVRFASSQKAR